MRQYRPGIGFKAQGGVDFNTFSPPDIVVGGPKRCLLTVEVVAASLYEAAVLALAEFRRCGFADATFGPATRLKVEVKGPAESHTISVGKLQSWLNGGAKSPNEKVEKERLRQRLDG